MIDYKNTTVKEPVTLKLIAKGLAELVAFAGSLASIFTLIYILS